MRRHVTVVVALTVAALAATGTAQAADTSTLTLDGAAAKRLKVAGSGGAKATRTRVTLAVRGFSVRGATATVRLRGTLTLRAGKRALRLTAPELRVGTTSRLTVRAGGQRFTLATLFAPAKVRSVSAAHVALDRAPATLTSVAARRIERALELTRRPRGRIGTLSLEVGAAPSPPAASPVAAPQVAIPAPSPDPTATPAPVPIDDGGPDPGAIGVCPTATNGYAAGAHVEPLPAAPPAASAIAGATIGWGFSASLRGSFKAFDPGEAETYVPRTVDGEDCAEPYRTFLTGAAQLADDTFRLTASDGWYDPVGGTAALNVAGGFRIGYFVGGWTRYPDAVPACEARGQYCGLWAAFTDAQITLGAASGTISAYADAGGNVPWRYVPWQRRAFATLDLGGIAPDTSVPGEVTWHAVPVTLTEEGGPLGLEYFGAGAQLDPITITLRT